MKNLSRLALSGLLATGLTLGSAAAFAQQNNPAPDASTQQPGNSRGQWGHQHMNADEQVARMTKRYSLTSDQQAQIKPILANQQQQVQTLRQTLLCPGKTRWPRSRVFAKMKAAKSRRS